MIVDGDEYKDDKFKKLNHELATEEYQAYIEYFKFLCEKEIKKVLLKNPSIKIGDEVPETLITQIKFAIPGWMIKDNNYTLKTSNEGLVSLDDIQIDITDKEYITNLLKTAIRELAISSANDALRPYGKKLGDNCIKDECIVDIN